MFKLICSLYALPELLKAREFKSLQNCSIDIVTFSQVSQKKQIKWCDVHTISSQKNNCFISEHHPWYKVFQTQESFVELFDDHCCHYVALAPDVPYMGKNDVVSIF
jgi:hypothetical protein